jgi:hypothetical protein
MTKGNIGIFRRTFWGHTFRGNIPGTYLRHEGDGEW